MKSVVTYPAVLMRINCPSCSEIAEIESNHVSKDDFMITCKKCGEEFQVRVNKRAAYRKEVSITGYYSAGDIKSIIDPDAKICKIIDISTGGISIEIHSLKFSPSVEKEGGYITMMFKLPGHEQTLKIKGKIAKVFQLEKKIKLGIQFVDLYAQDSREISLFMMP
jgi:hypothetical protein